MKNRILSYLTTAAIGLILPIQASYAQGYKIETTIKGVQDTTLILSYRYGTKFYSLDTARTNIDGYAVFEDTTKINRGMYQVILPDKSFIDFFIDDEYSISISTEKGALVESLSSKTSKGNQLFFEWQAKNQVIRKKAEAVQQKIKGYDSESPELIKLQEDLLKIREENKLLWENYILKLGDHLAGKFLRGMRPFEVPEEVYVDDDGKRDQLAQYEYYKDHFFDATDFADPALIRTPLIHAKLQQFFTSVVPGIPDSVIYYAEKVIGLSRSDPEMFQFVVQFLLNHYSEPKIMGMDAVYVHVAENYYMTGLATWVDEQNLKLITERVKTLKPLLLGNFAPTLSGLETPEGEGINISDINARLTILYFWEPDCSFCKTATPNLMKIYKDFREKEVEVIAVNTRLEIESWEKFIAEHELTWINVYSPNNVRELLSLYEAYSTPKVFVLDRDKKIVAKDISVDQLPQVLDHLLKTN